MNKEPRSFDGENIPRTELLFSIGEDTQQLISALKVQRDPDIERTLLSIDLTNPDFQFPDFIQRNIAADSNLVELTIDSTVNRLTQRADLCLQSHISGVEDMFIYIAVSHTTNGEPQTSIVVDNMELPCLDPPKKHELNRFLASLLVRNKTGDYSAFDTMDLSSAHITERLIDEVRDVTNEVITDGTYFLGQVLSPNTDSINFVEQNGTLLNATVCIEHHKKASALDLIYVNQHDEQQPETAETKKLSEAVDNPEFLMQHLEGAYAYAQNVDGESVQVESSSDFLVVVHDFVKTKLDTVFTNLDVPLDEETVDSASIINFEDRRD